MRLGRKVARRFLGKVKVQVVGSFQLMHREAEVSCNFLQDLALGLCYVRRVKSIGRHQDPLHEDFALGFHPAHCRAVLGFNTLPVAITELLAPGSADFNAKALALYCVLGATA